MTRVADSETRVTHPRLFVALDLPDSVREPLAGLALGPQWRPVPAANLHVTLVFLGTAPVPELPSFPGPAPELRLGRVIALGRVLAVELEDPTGALRTLQARLADALGVHEARPFRPHVTIGRARPRTRPRVPAVDLPPLGFRGRAVTLYASTLHPEGARYTPLATSYIQP